MSETVPGLLPGAAGKAGFFTTLKSWVFTTDHKRIGVLYIIFAFIFFAVGGALAGLIRVQLATPDSQLFTGAVFNGMVGMHGTIMIFLWVMPVMTGLINYVMPLQIGAKDMAFPRANSLGLWLFVGGGLILMLAFFFGMPQAGWTAYVPLSLVRSDIGMDIWIIGIQLLGISSIISGLNFLVTIVKLRAPGMTIFKIPLFVWSTMVTGWLLVLAMPALTVGLGAVLLERHLDVTFFNSATGGDPLLYQHLFWFFGHPEVYVLIMPAFGIISEIIPAHARKPIFGYKPMAFSMIAIAFISFLLWVHHMFSSGMDPIATIPFSILTMIIGVPTGIKIFNWLATLWKGKIHFEPPMLFALGFIITFTMGGLTGVMLAVVPVDLHVTDTYFVVGHMHYVMFGGSVMAIYGGICHWFPKVTGRMLNKGLAHLHFWLTFIGLNLTFLPMHWLGFFGMQRRIATYADAPQFTDSNVAATIGGFIMGAGAIALLINIIWSIKKGKEAGNNPWRAVSFEWDTTSPPPAHNFDVQPEMKGLPYAYGETAEEEETSKGKKNG